MPAGGSGLKGQRIGWLDVLKGVGIILVVLGHTHASFRQYIYTFHIPLFFFAAGYLFKPREGVLQQVGRRAQTLLIPYIFFAALSLLLAPWVSGQEAPLLHSLTQLGLSTRSQIAVNQTLWFLTCMFVVQVIFIVLSRFIRNPWLQLIIVLPLAFVGFRTVDAPIMPFSADAALYYLFFMWLGRTIAVTFDLRESRIFAGLSTACLVLVGYLLAAPSLAARVIQAAMEASPAVSFAAGLGLAVAGIAAVMRVSLTLRESQLLARLGRSSLTIFTLHIFVLDGVFYALTAAGLQVNQAVNSYAIAAAATAIAVVVPIARGLEQSAGYLVGMPSRAASVADVDAAPAAPETLG